LSQENKSLCDYIAKGYVGRNIGGAAGFIGDVKNMEQLAMGLSRIFAGALRTEQIEK
jgi:hypothetical protein